MYRPAVLLKLDKSLSAEHFWVTGRSPLGPNVAQQGLAFVYEVYAFQS